MSLDFQAPLPPDGSFVEATRKSCAAARKASDILISEEAIDSFLRGLDQDTFDRLKVKHGANFPLQFPSVASEVNFLSVLALLNTLSAYRSVLHQSTGQGAYQNVMRLMMAMYISSPDSDTSPSSKLSAQGLATLTEGEVANLLNVSLHDERPHNTIPGLIVGTRGGPMAEPVGLVVQICNDTGKRLLDMKAANLGEFVAKLLIEASSETARNGDASGCDLFVQRLVSALPGFADMTTLSPGREPVYLFKKAFFLLYSLRARLPKVSSNLRVPDTASLPMFVDNVIPTMLVHYKIIQFGPSASATLVQQNPASRRSLLLDEKNKCVKIETASWDRSEATKKTFQLMGYYEPEVRYKNVAKAIPNAYIYFSGRLRSQEPTTSYFAIVLDDTTWASPSSTQTIAAAASSPTTPSKKPRLGGKRSGSEANNPASTSSTASSSKS
ncbi:unnamed protein product [Tilletia controversa]|nr:unnamed protein product [Tilletia controversa]